MVSTRALARWWSVISTGLKVCLVLATLLVSSGIIYLGGGTEGRFSALAHLYYVPIVVAGLAFGPIAGVLTGLGAALLGGPLMLANAALQVMQPASEWLTRAFFFIMIGATVGELTARLRGTLQTEQQQREQLSQFGRETLAALVETMAQRDSYTGNHVNRIVGYVTAIAQRLNLPAEQMEIIRYAAQLHDIGKLAVPTDILRKPGPLSRAEWHVIEQHPVIGSQILEQISVLRDTASLVRHHHERYDGTGYPNGLQGDEIPLGARIIAVADAFDAMTSDRPYRRAMPFKEAVYELVAAAGTQFDPDIVATLLEILGLKEDDIRTKLVIPVSAVLSNNAVTSNVISNNGKCYVDVKLRSLAPQRSRIF